MAFIKLKQVKGNIRGSILYLGTSGIVVEDNANLFWDSSNIRLGIGTNSPSTTLQVGTSLYVNDLTGISSIGESIDSLQGGLKIKQSVSNLATLILEASGTSGAHSNGIILRNNTASRWGFGIKSMASLDFAFKKLATGDDDFYADGLSVLEFDYSSGSVIVNETGDPRIDFRVEGDTDMNLFRTDASTDSVGIGTSLPTAKLHINGSFRLSNLTTIPAAGYVLQSTDANGNADWVALDANALTFTNALEGVTNSSTEKELFINGISPNRVDIASGETIGFEIQVVARDTSTGDSWMHKVTGAIKNVSGVTSLIGAVTDTTIAEDTSTTSWSVSVTADDTNDALAIKVTGETGKTITWKATIVKTAVS